MNRNLVSIVVDEIALEGLDGITIDALWKRLEIRDKFIQEQTGTRVLPSLTEQIKSKIFSQILKQSNQGNVDFHILDEPRTALVVFDRNKNFKRDSGTIEYPETMPENIYNPVRFFNQDNLRGSCKCFDTRQILDHCCESYDAFCQKYPDQNSVLLVASQKQRAISLFGEELWQKYSELRIESYCLLEFIGRSRNFGYLNSAQEAIQYEDTNIQQKKAFYYDKGILAERGLILQFPIYYTDKNKSTNYNSSLICLPRFRPMFVTPIDGALIACATQFYLKKTTNLPVADLRDVFVNHFADPQLKVPIKRMTRLLFRFPHLFSTGKSEDSPKESSTVRYELPLHRPIRFDDLYPSSTEAISSSSPSANDMKIELEEDSESILINAQDISVAETLNSTALQTIRVESKILKKDFLNKVFKFIESHESKGCSRPGLCQKIDLPFLLVRGAIKNLTEMGLIYQTPVFIGKNNVFQFISNRFQLEDSNENDRDYKQIMGEIVSDIMKKRIDFIRDYIEEKKAFEDIFHLIRDIRIWEEQRCIPILIDRRTVRKILQKFIELKYLNFRGYFMSYGHTSFRYTIYSHPSVQFDSGQLIQQTDSKHLIVDNLSEHMLLRKKFAIFQNEDVDLNDVQVVPIASMEIKPEIENDNESEQISSFKLVLSKIESRNLYRARGSRLERVFLFYRFLHFLLVPQDPTSRDTVELASWHKFVPRLHKIFPNRSCQLLDIMPYIPIRIFCDIFPINYNVPELKEHLNHSSKQFGLLYQIPSNIRAHLLYTRKSVGLFTEFIEMGRKIGLFSIHSNRQNEPSEPLIQNCPWIKVNTELHFEYPLISEGPTHYTFNTVSDVNLFIDDVEIHLTTDSCIQQNQERCSFSPELKVHSLVAFGVRGRKRKIEQVEELVAQKKAKASKTKARGSLRKKLLKMSRNTKENVSSNKQKVARKRPADSLRLRQMWTRAEDQFILKCRLVSMIMEPNHPLMTNVTRVFISKFMSKRLQEEFDKEDGSISKRLTLLLRKPLVIKTLSYALLELDYIDVEAFHSSEETQEKAKEDIFEQIFDVVDKHKFTYCDFFLTREERENSKFQKQQSFEIPDSLKEFKQSFTIVTIPEETRDQFFCEPKNFYCIHGYVIGNIVISALLSGVWMNDHKTITSVTNSRNLVENNPYLRPVYRSLKHFSDIVQTATIRKMEKLGILKLNKRFQRQMRSRCYSHRLAPNFYEKLRSFYIPLFLCLGNDEKIVENRNSSFNVWQFVEALCGDVLRLDEEENYENYHDKMADFEIDIPEEFLQTTMKSDRFGRNTSIRALISNHFESKKENEDSSEEGRILNEIILKHINVKIEKLVDRNDLDLHMATIEELKRKSKRYVVSELEKTFTGNLNEFCGGLPRKIAEKIVQNLEAAGELGLKEGKLQELLKFDKRTISSSLHGFLRQCEDHELLFEVGICERTWVHRRFVRYWLAHSHDNIDENEQQPNEGAIEQIVYFPKLWKLPSGKVDLNTLFAYFNLIVGHLSFKRMSTMATMHTTFGDLCPAVQLRELLDYLSLLGCVKKNRVASKPVAPVKNISNFGDYFNQNFPISDDEDDDEDDTTSEHSSLMLDEFGEVQYEATLNSTTKLASFYQTLLRENFS